MDTAQLPESEAPQVPPSIQCESCHSALTAPNRETPSYLLLDQFTVPLLGCVDHLEQFRAICGFTTGDTADLLGHPPAGGIRCPTCRLTARTAGNILVPVSGGATVILGCQEHQSRIAERYETGRRIRQQLAAPVTEPATFE